MNQVGFSTEGFYGSSDILLGGPQSDKCTPHAPFWGIFMQGNWLLMGVVTFCILYFILNFMDFIDFKVIRKIETKLWNKKKFDCSFMIFKITLN